MFQGKCFFCDEAYSCSFSAGTATATTTTSCSPMMLATCPASPCQSFHTCNSYGQCVIQRKCFFSEWFDGSLLPYRLSCVVCRVRVRSEDLVAAIVLGLLLLLLCFCCCCWRGDCASRRQDRVVIVHRSPPQVPLSLHHYHSSSDSSGSGLRSGSANGSYIPVYSNPMANA